MKLNERTNRRNNHGRYTKAEMIEGKTMLKAALRVIKEHENAGNPLLPDAGLIPLSAAGAMTAPRLRRKNLKAIVVTRRNGGWIADLVLNNAPGMGDVIGTPDELPYPTKKMAQTVGFLLILSVLNAAGAAD